MTICNTYPLAGFAPERLQKRRIPRLESSFADCGYMFGQFKEHLIFSGSAAIIAIHCAWPSPLPELTSKAMALFIRTMGKRLTGRIGGGYRAGEGDFFLLLVPTDNYHETDYKEDLEKLRAELLYYFLQPHVVRKTGISDSTELTTRLIIDGVFLVNRIGETADNALLRAFQELFSSSLLPSPGMLAESREIERIINEELVSPVFQPIFSLTDGSVHGYEALSRITDNSLPMNTEELFERAASHGLTGPLERLCRQKALIRATELGTVGHLFLNVCPALLQSGDHQRGFTAALMEKLGIERSRVTFELTERTLIEDHALFRRVISHYREQGYAIAIDDLGSGYAGLKMLAEVEPDYVKLSSFLIKNIHRSGTRQALTEALVTFCRRIGAKVIAEGIEEPAELEYLRVIGVEFGQGYLLAKPAPAPLPAGFFLPSQTFCPIATAL